MPSVLGIDITTDAERKTAETKRKKYIDYIKQQATYLKLLEDVKKKHNWTDKDLKDKGIWVPEVMDPYIKYRSESNTKMAGGKAGVPFLPNLPEATLVTPIEGADTGQPFPDQAALDNIARALSVAEAAASDVRIANNTTRTEIESIAGNRATQSGISSRRIQLLEEKGPPIGLEPAQPVTQRQNEHAQPEQAAPIERPPQSSSVPAQPMPQPMPPPTQQPSLPSRIISRIKKGTPASRRNKLLESIMRTKPNGAGQTALRKKADEIIGRNPMPADWESNPEYQRRIAGELINSPEYNNFRPREQPAPPQQITRPSDSAPTGVASRADVNTATGRAANIARMRIIRERPNDTPDPQRNAIINGIINNTIEQANDLEYSSGDLASLPERLGQQMFDRISAALDEINRRRADAASAASSSDSAPPANMPPKPTQPPRMETDEPPVRPPDPSYEDILTPPDKVLSGVEGFPVMFHPPRDPAGGIVIPPNPSQVSGGGMPLPNPWRPPYGQPDGDPREEKKAGGGGGAPQPQPQPQPYPEPQPEPDGPERKVKERPIKVEPEPPEQPPKDKKKPPKDEPPDKFSSKPNAAHLPDATKSQGGYGYLRPFFSDYHGIDLLTQTNAERLEDIKEFDLFDIPVEENETLDNPLFRHELRNKMFRFSGIATDPTFYKGANLRQSQFTDPPEVRPTINTFVAANQLEDKGPDAPNLWYNPYSHEGRPIVSDAYRTAADEGGAMIDQLNIHPELEQLAKYKPDAPFNVDVTGSFVRPVKFDALESY